MFFLNFKNFKKFFRKFVSLSPKNYSSDTALTPTQLILFYLLFVLNLKTLKKSSDLENYLKQK